MKDAMTYANEAGFFSFNVIGWKAEFERLIEAVRADALAELATVKESLTAQSPDHIAGAGKVILTAEAAQQIEETLLKYTAKWAGEDVTPDHTRKALASIRLAIEILQSKTRIENNKADSFKVQEPVGKTEHVEKTAESTHVNQPYRYAGRFCND